MMSSTEWTYVVLRFAQYAAEWLKGDKDVRAWYLSLTVTAGYICWALMIKNPAMLAFSVGSGLIQYRNLRCWTGGKECPAKTEESSTPSSPSS